MAIMGVEGVDALILIVVVVGLDASIVVILEA